MGRERHRGYRGASYLRAGGPAALARLFLVVLCFGFFGGSEVRAQVMSNSVTTNPASNVGLSSATLSADIASTNSTGLTIGFDFGTSTAYGTTVAATWVSSTPNQGSISGTVAGNASELRCGTTYYFRARMQHRGGTYTGGGRTFVTLPCPIALYRFDNESLEDGSGNGYALQPGEAAAAPQFSVRSSARGNAAQGTCGYRTFIRTNRTYLALPKKFPNLGSDGKAFTIAAWVRTSDISLSQRIFADDDSNDGGNRGGYALSLGDDNHPGMIRFYSRATDPIVLDSANEIIKNDAWYFVAAIADVPNRKKYLHVFDANGTVQTSPAPESTFFGSTFGADSGLASIGGETAASLESAGTAFSGDLDEVMIFPAALSQGNIAALLSTTARPCTNIVNSSNSSVVASPTTVRADGSSVSTIIVTIRDGAGREIPKKKVSLSANAGSSVITAINSMTDDSGIARFSVADGKAETVTYSASADGVSIAQTAGVSFADYTLDAVEPDGAVASKLFTKLAGSSFSLDVLPLAADGKAYGKAFTGTVTVDLVSQAQTDAGGCGTVPVGCATVPSEYTYLASDNGRKRFAFSCAAAGAAKDVRVRLRSGKLTGCSTDNFAIRPKEISGVSFSVVRANDVQVNGADASGVSVAATPTVKAGAKFVVGVTTAAGYTGVPKFNPGRVATPPGNAGGGGWTSGALSGTFAAAVAGTLAGIPVSTSVANDATYSEVGYFRLEAYGVYDDSFSSVDQAGSDTAKWDCTPDYVNDSANGKLGCYFGNTAATDYFGRFIPDHFTTAVTPGCGAAFTYSGQPFTVRVDARNGSGNVTKNYDDAAGAGYAKSVGLVKGAGGDGVLTNASIPASSFASGSATSSTPVFSFAVSPAVPASISLRASDTDGVSSNGFTEGTTEIRSGRIALGNAIGSELLPLPVPLGVQYYAALSAWLPNAADTCSSVTAGDFAFDFSGVGNALAACETAVALGGTVPAQTVTLAAPGAGNHGTATLRLNLGGAASGNACAVPGGASAAATTSNKPWLRFSWTGAGAADPSARITFGQRRRGPVIYARERY